MNLIDEKEMGVLSLEETFQRLNTSADGLSDREAIGRLKIYGKNLVRTKKRHTVLKIFFSQFKSPLTLILFVASLFSLLLNDKTNSVIILIIVLISIILGFIQEKGALDIINRLLITVKSTFITMRKGKQKNIHLENIVPGDILLLKSGDMVPADCLLIEEKDLFIDESPLTGESLYVEKKIENNPSLPLLKRPNLLFMGTHIINGMAKAVVINTGKRTEMGKISEKIAKNAPEPAFEKGVRNFGYLLMKITFLFILAIFILNIFLNRPIFDSLLFSLAIAIGFTPELLPMIITVNLARGAKHMSKQKVIIKKLNAIENFGSMDILCCDKTGTLTKGVIELYSAVNSKGSEDENVRLYASINASFQTGFPNPLDKAILEKVHPNHTQWKKLDEIPYDFERKRLAILTHKDTENLLIVKGAFHNILSVCEKAQISSEKTVQISEAIRDLEAFFMKQSQNGYRVLGIAYKAMGQKQKIEIQDESALTFLGFLLFYDPPKPHVEETLAEMMQLGIRLKMITGDNRFVATYIAEKVGFKNKKVITGEELDKISDQDFFQTSKDHDVFAEISPMQKERILLLLKKNEHIVGYLGDGLNDTVAFHSADVSISVDSAPAFIKERAEIVLLDKNLLVLVKGIKEGRRTFANTMKYILMATSSNFGNMLSMAGASLFLKFFPLLPKQILLNNLLTDLSEISISTDGVDPEMEKKAWKWDLKWIKKFMIVFGITSSLFDIITFLGLIFFFHASETQFRTAWFIESVLTATLIILFIRTRKPFYKSRPSKYLFLTTFFISFFSIILPWTKFASLFEFIPLTYPFFLFIFAVLIGYMSLIECIKYFFYGNRWQATK